MFYEYIHQCDVSVRSGRLLKTLSYYIDLTFTLCNLCSLTRLWLPSYGDEITASVAKELQLPNSIRNVSRLYTSAIISYLEEIGQG
jgi:hypothetical protein